MTVDESEKEKGMKKYTIEVTSENGTCNVSSTNDGFTAFELIGILESKKLDIIAQMTGEIKPTITKREVVK